MNFYVKERNGLYFFYWLFVIEVVIYFVWLMERYLGREDLRGMMRGLDKKVKDFWL